MTMLHLALLALGLIGNTAQAQPVVIHSGNGAVPMGTYLGHLVAGVDQPGVLEGLRFPIRAVGMAPGVLSDAQAQAARDMFKAEWLAHPVFVVGTDPLSRQWMSEHRQVLIELGASGLVVQAESERAFKELQKLAGGAALAPVVGDWLPALLRGAGVQSYPLVILADGRLSSVPPRRNPTATVVLEAKP